MKPLLGQFAIKVYQEGKELLRPVSAKNGALSNAATAHWPLQDDL